MEQLAKQQERRRRRGRKEGKREEKQEGKREDQTLGGEREQPLLRETTGNYSMLLGGGAVTAGGKTGVKASEKKRLER